MKLYKKAFLFLCVVTIFCFFTHLKIQIIMAVAE